ncbi:MAG: DSD1 family PLP-dependent enzyme [Chloroflexi bacterium]|nr:DSD1 family PLP-dependent enzyme [Chloroflexota bacterium]
MIGRSKWELDTPALVLDLDAMERNIARMSAVFRQAGVGWRPHTKAIKMPALAHQLLRAGAFGVTCAKVSEADVMANAGIRDILIANQVVGEPKITRLVNLLPYADVIVAVDNPSNVAALDRAATRKGLPLRVVVEVNVGMNRAGVEPGAAAVELARMVDGCAGLHFAGVMGWEGQTVGITDLEVKRRAIAQSVGLLTDTADRCRAAGLSVQIVSCGGTGTYQFSSTLAGITEVQAGGGIFCDVHYHEDMQVEHEYALTVLATITSRPWPTRIITDSGKKTMSSDAAVPRPLIEAPVTSVSLSAEHARIELGAPVHDMPIGDKLEFLVGYTDTTTMLHDQVYGTRDGQVEVVWSILGRGKLQ